jgi:hypothetical protein
MISSCDLHCALLAHPARDLQFYFAKSDVGRAIDEIERDEGKTAAKRYPFFRSG